MFKLLLFSRLILSNLQLDFKHKIHDGYILKKENKRQKKNAKQRYECFITDVTKHGERGAGK